jgi:hypothetical protein
MVRRRPSVNNPESPILVGEFFHGAIQSAAKLARATFLGFVVGFRWLFARDAHVRLHAALKRGYLPDHLFFLALTFVLVAILTGSLDLDLTDERGLAWERVSQLLKAEASRQSWEGVSNWLFVFLLFLIGAAHVVLISRAWPSRQNRDPLAAWAAYWFAFAALIFAIDNCLETRAPWYAAIDQDLRGVLLWTATCSPLAIMLFGIGRRRDANFPKRPVWVRAFIVFASFVIALTIVLVDVLVCGLGLIKFGELLDDAQTMRTRTEIASALKPLNMTCRFEDENSQLMFRCHLIGVNTLKRKLILVKPRVHAMTLEANAENLKSALYFTSSLALASTLAGSDNDQALVEPGAAFQIVLKGSLGKWPTSMHDTDEAEDTSANGSQKRCKAHFPRPVNTGLSEVISFGTRLKIDVKPMSSDGTQVPKHEYTNDVDWLATTNENAYLSTNDCFPALRRVLSGKNGLALD